MDERSRRGLCITPSRAGTVAKKPRLPTSPQVPLSRFTFPLSIPSVPSVFQQPSNPPFSLVHIHDTTTQSLQTDRIHPLIHPSIHPSTLPHSHPSPTAHHACPRRAYPASSHGRFARRRCRQPAAVHGAPARDGPPRRRGGRL